MPGDGGYLGRFLQPLEPGVEDRILRHPRLDAGVVRRRELLA